MRTYILLYPVCCVYVLQVASETSAAYSTGAPESTSLLSRGGISLDLQETELSATDRSGAFDHLMSAADLLEAAE